MASFSLEYAQDHLTELFHRARNGAEIVIVREDGRACELTPLAEVWVPDEVKTMTVPVEEPAEPASKEPEAAPGDLVPA